MTVHYDDGTVRILHGDARQQMAGLADGSVTAVVTDPPYGLSREPDVAEVLRHWLAGDDYTHTGGGFMGRTWDSFVPGPSVWREAYRVLPPGGWLLAFGGTRTYDLLSIAIRLAGFELRDSIAEFGPRAWLHGSGFPKSRACLKPGWEPVIVARRPGSSVLQIDAARIGPNPGWYYPNGAGGNTFHGQPRRTDPEISKGGRWPPNVAMLHGPGCQPVGTRKVRGSVGVQSPHAFGLINDDGWQPNSHGQQVGYADPDGTETVQAWDCEPDCPVALLDQQSGDTRSQRTEHRGRGWSSEGSHEGWRRPAHQQYQSSGGYDDWGGASRFYFTAKASRAERVTVDGERHPTVKPLALMRWLVRLVTPPGGTVLDPFCGSGSTLVAAALEGFHAVGIEADERWCRGSAKRVAERPPVQEVLAL